MQTRKRTYKELKSIEAISEETDFIPKYRSSKKFYFEYSLTKDGKYKPKTSFISFEENKNNLGSIALNYEKYQEIMTLHQYSNKTYIKIN